MNCSSCGSDNTQKFSVVYEQGTRTGNSVSLSGNEAEHFSQTPLAKKCSPPEEPKAGGLFTVIGLVVSLFVALKVGNFLHGFWYGVAVFFATLIVLHFVWRLTIGNRERAAYTASLSRWQQSWVCLKCGNAFSGEARA